MTMTNSALQARVKDFNWLLSSFAENTTGVEQSICVSADGLLMAMSSSLDRGSADKLAAIVSGLRSLSDGASRVMGRGGVNQVIVEMQEGFILGLAHGGARTISRWIAGKPEASFWTGAKSEGREQHLIQSFRCVGCGYLESYARES